MKTAIVSLTKNGGVTAKKVQDAIGGDLFCRVPPKGEEASAFQKPLKELMTDLFPLYDRFVMIMATGIVVRTISPLIVKKDRDPAIVVMDEMGRFAISLLSGHLGGANKLAAELEETMKATAVITTATDINKMVAFDMVAKENRCAIEDLSRLAAVSGALVNGKSVKLFCPYLIDGTVPTNIRLTDDPAQSNVCISNRKEAVSEETLILRPKNLILGAGCRKGKPYADIKEAFETFLAETGFAKKSLCAVVSIDLKAEEEGLLRLSEELGIPFETYTAEELRPFDTTEGDSDFVRKVVGVGSVSEAAALRRSNGGETLIPKRKYNGITFSLAQCPTKIRLS